MTMSRFRPNIVFKYCFEDEIHKSFSTPTSFEDLQNNIISIFGDRLPKNYAIKYLDADHDLITISCDDEYSSMMCYDRPRNQYQETIKIFVLPVQKGSDKTSSTANSKKDESHEKITSPAKSSEGSFEVVDDSSQSIIAGHISEISLSFGEDKEREREKEIKVSPLPEKNKTPRHLTIEIPEYVLPAYEENNETDVNLEDTQIDKKEESEPDFERDICEQRSFSLRPDEDEAQLTEHEESVNSHNNTIERLEARVAVLRKQLDLSRTASQSSLNLEQPPVSENEEEEHDTRHEESYENSLHHMLRNFVNKREQLRKEEEENVRMEDSFASREVDSDSLIYMRKQKVRDEILGRIQEARERMIAMRNGLVYKDFAPKVSVNNWMAKTEKINNYPHSNDESMERDQPKVPSFGQNEGWRALLEQKENMYPQPNYIMKRENPALKNERLDYKPYRELVNGLYRPLINESNGPSEPFEESNCSIDIPRLQDRSSWALDPAEPKEYHNSLYYSYDGTLHHERNNDDADNSEVFQSPMGKMDPNPYYERLQGQQGVQTPESENEWWNPKYRELRGCFKKPECSVCRNFEYCEHNRSNLDKRRPSIELGTDYSGSSVKSVSVRNLLEIPESGNKMSRTHSPDIRDNATNLDVFDEIHRTCETIDRYLNLRDLSNRANSDEMIARSPMGGSEYAFQVMTGLRSNLQYFGNMEKKGVVYKTVYIENVGTKPWRRCLVKSVGPVGGRPVELAGVQVGEVVMVTLEMRGGFAPGAYTSQWRLIHENANGMVELIGEPFSVEFIIDGRMGEVVGELESDTERSLKDFGEVTESNFDDTFDGHGNKQDQDKLEWNDEQQAALEGTEGTEKCGADAVLAKYQKYREEISKVWLVRSWYPEDDLEKIIAFVNERPYLNANEAVWAYQRARLNMEGEDMVEEEF